MSNYSKSDVVLVRYPFSDLTGAKFRPAVIISSPHVSQDVFILPLTSKITNLLAGEFILHDWNKAGLNVPTTAKRGVFTIQQKLIVQKLGVISDLDMQSLNQALKMWLGL